MTKSSLTLDLHTNNFTSYRFSIHISFLYFSFILIFYFFFFRLKWSEFFVKKWKESNHFNTNVNQIHFRVNRLLTSDISSTVTRVLHFISFSSNSSYFSNIKLFPYLRHTYHSLNHVEVMNSYPNYVFFFSRFAINWIF